LRLLISCHEVPLLRLRTVEVLPPNIDRSLIDVTGNQMEEVNRAWCGQRRRRQKADCGRPILEVAIHDKQALKSIYPAEILDSADDQLI
jgi:hypothetical protein